MIKNILLFLACFSFVFSSFGQTTYNVKGRVSGLNHNYDCGTDVGSGNPNPRWKLWWAYNATGFVQFSSGGNIVCSGNNVFGLEDASCGFNNTFNLVSSELTNTTITQYNIDMECWEEDGCGGSDDCSAGGNGFFCNADDIQTSRGRIANVNYQTQPPCSEHNWGLFYRLGSPNNYGAEVRVNWSYNTINPADIGSINGAGQSICAGGDPSIISSTSAGLPYAAYQWQFSDDAGGTWADVVGATSASYDPPVLASTRHFRRKETLCVGGNIASASPTDFFTNVHIVTVETSSVAPTMVVSNPLNVCGTGTVTLTASGGTVGTGASYEWYDDACGGNLIGTTVGPTLAGINVTTATTFFVRLNGNCNTTGCVSTTVNVTTPSIAATSIGGGTTVCAGTSVSLNVVGGSLGTAATWEWYDGGCGLGVNVGSGASVNVTPSVTTTYYARAEGGCGPTACVSVVVNVDQPSVDPTGINASAMSFCSPGSSTLTVTGGSLGTGASWEWFEAGCGAGVSIGAGSSITVSPTTTTTYYVRATGTCNVTACVSTTITVDQSGTDPTSILAGNTNLCPGQSTTLTVGGGSLGTGATWEWYTGSCGGTAVGTGNAISVTPSANTTYFVRAEGSCGNSNCATTMITVGVGAADPTSATVINNNICPGDVSQIFVTGGVLPTGYTWVWYTGACGAIPVGVGDTISVTPTADETYYVRATGTCGNTNCTSVTVNVQSGSLPASGILATGTDVCPGGSTTLNVIGGNLITGAQWTWYEGSCGGTSIGTGIQLLVTPSSSTTYYVRAEGGSCIPTECRSIAIGVYEANVYMVPFDAVCGIGSPIVLNHGLPAGGAYSGVGVEGTVFDPFFTFDPSISGVGTHTVTYSYQVGNGCFASVDADIVVAASTLTASATVEMESCSDGGITIVASVVGGAGFYTYTWSNGEVGNPLNYAAPGTYNVTVTDADNCSATYTGIEVAEDLECIEVANSFTPNGDGMNDTWNLDFSTYSSANLKVFSKWGTLVYETDGLTINWNGTSLDGNNLPANTYYYIIELDGGSKTQNGPITIVR